MKYVSMTKPQVLEFMRWAQAQNHPDPEDGWAHCYYCAVSHLQGDGLLTDTPQPIPSERLWEWDRTIDRYLHWCLEEDKEILDAGLTIGTVYIGRTVLRPGDLDGSPDYGSVVIFGDDRGVLMMRDEDYGNSVECEWVPMENATLGGAPATGFDQSGVTLAQTLAVLFRRNPHLRKLLEES